MEEEHIVRVRADSTPSAVAGALAGMFRERGRAVAQAIGAGAVNQMVKAAATAVSFLAADGLEVATVPEFAEVVIDGQNITALRMTFLEVGRNGT